MSNVKNNQDDNDSSTLFYARNEYYVGNFLNSVNYVLPVQDDASVELLSYMYLSYLAIGSGRLVATYVKEDNDTPLLALRYIHEAFEKPEKIEEIIDKMLGVITISEDETNIWHLAIAILYCYNQKYENALKVLQRSSNIESMALSVQCLLRLNRIDMAKQLVSKIQEISDDHTLTQLSQAWVALCASSDQMQDAFHIFQELCEKYQSSPLLLNGQAVAHLGLERYEEAESILRDALNKKHNDYDSLINIMVLAHLNGKSHETIQRYWEQIQQFHPKSEFVTNMKRKTEEFDRLCLQYSINGNTDES